MELEIVEVADDRVHVVDRRGRLVQAFASRREGEAFASGYRIGREDAATILRNTLEPLPERVTLSRT
jgi:hypothetical protein